MDITPPESSVHPRATSAAMQECIRRYRNGDPGAFTTLRTEFTKLVQGTLVNMLGASGVDRDTLEDLAQEVWWKVWKARARVRETDRFQGWIQRITQNVARDHRKSPHVRTTGVRQVRWWTSPSNSGRGEDALNGEQAAEDMRAIPADRVVAAQEIVGLCRKRFAAETQLLWERDVLGYSHADLAQRYATTAGVMKMRVHRARMRLRAFLTGMGDAA